MYFFFTSPSSSAIETLKAFNNHHSSLQEDLFFEQYYQGGVEMIRRDLLTGHWLPYLERAISLKPCYEGGINGGEVLLFA